MTRNEIIEAVLALDGENLSERAEDELVANLEQKLPHARITELIFYSTPELTAEQIADEALRRESTARTTLPQ
jgi:hypothetical protein